MVEGNENKVIIGVPELYKEMKDNHQFLTEKLEDSDKKNRERDEANQKELRNWIKGNGKPGLEERQSNTEQSLKRNWWVTGIIVGGILTVAFFVIRSGILS